MIALAITTGVGFFAYSMMSSSSAPAVIREEKIVEKPAPTVKIIVAVKDLQVGKRIDQSDLSWREWPEDMYNPVFIRSDTDKAKSDKQINDLIGGIARFPIASGEPITSEKIFRTGDRSTMSGLLRDGMRAVAVAISPENSAGGFIMPGDIVDVVLTTGLNLDDEEATKAGLFVGASRVLGDKTMGKKMPEKEKIVPKLLDANNKNLPTEEFYKKLNQEEEMFVGGASTYAETLLGNVRVLGIDRNVSPEKDSKDQGQNLGTTATLEVTEEQAKLLAWAAAAGKITLTLRSLIENSVGENQRQMDILPETKSAYATSINTLLNAGNDGLNGAIASGKLQIMRSSNNLEITTKSRVSEPLDKKDEAKK